MRGLRIAFASTERRGQGRTVPQNEKSFRARGFPCRRSPSDVQHSSGGDLLAGFGQQEQTVEPNSFNITERGRLEMIQKQQGDIVLRMITKIPAAAKTVKRTKRVYILAEGEATGHCHVITKEIELFEKDGVLYITNEKSVVVEHEEHQPVTLEPGTWEVGRVLEYDYFKEMVRLVKD